MTDVLTFWFVETAPDQWFKKDAAFDEAIRRRFSALHEALAITASDIFLADAHTALATVLVFDQMPRNMFRDTPRAYATDPQALLVAQRPFAH